MSAVMEAKRVEKALAVLDAMPPKPPAIRAVTVQELAEMRFKARNPILVPFLHS